MRRSTLFIFGILGVLLFCNLFYTKYREGQENKSKKVCDQAKSLNDLSKKMPGGLALAYKSRAAIAMAMCKRMKKSEAEANETKEEKMKRVCKQAKGLNDLTVKMTPISPKMALQHKLKAAPYNIACQQLKKAAEKEKKAAALKSFLVAKAKNKAVKNEIVRSKKEMAQGKESDKKDFLAASSRLDQMKAAKKEQINFDLANRVVNQKPSIKGMPNIGGDKKDVLFQLSFDNIDANDDGSIDKSEFKGIGKSALEAFGIREGFAGDKNWKVTIDEGGDLVFNHNGKTVTKITKQGEIVSTKCKCGMWNLRDSRIGIPGRNDMNLHKDGWFRALNYGAPEITAGRHKHGDYTKGGFAGKELWYGGSIGGRLHRG